ncbi:hypothetical protein ACIQD5_29080 [Streptomyces microflavus]
MIKQVSREGLIAGAAGSAAMTLAERGVADLLAAQEGTGPG